MSLLLARATAPAPSGTGSYYDFLLLKIPTLGSSQFLMGLSIALVTIEALINGDIYIPIFRRRRR